jgi:hypothetical protein
VLPAGLRGGLAAGLPDRLRRARHNLAQDS